MKNSVAFYEDSYQFNSEKTDLNISKDYIEMILAMQYEFRATKKALWAIVSTNGEEVARYKFSYGKGLEEIILNKAKH